MLSTHTPNLDMSLLCCSCKSTHTGGWGGLDREEETGARREGDSPGVSVSHSQAQTGVGTEVKNTPGLEIRPVMGDSGPQSHSRHCPTPTPCLDISTIFSLPPT